MKVEFVKDTFFKAMIQSNAESGMIFTSNEWIKIVDEEGFFQRKQFAAKDICNMDSCILTNTYKDDHRQN